jgi:ubiquinone/menaquinone biosynthesis C-methylase UbiE
MLKDYSFDAIFSEFIKRLDVSRNASYSDREGRNRFVASSIFNDVEGSILNIGGGGKRHLEKSLANNNVYVTEVDIVGDCDYVLNLDKIERLPFEDESFDASCAFDVLEHLEQFHLINSEMFRVSRKEMVVSLPISSSEILGVVRNKKTYKGKDRLDRGVYSKYYGLPLSVPEDRHRWWLYFDDIVQYYLIFSEEKKCSVKFYMMRRAGFFWRVVKFFVGNRLFYNFFHPHIFVHLKKT